MNSYSDGGGRSGVYLEVDANLELLEEDGLVDVFGYLKMLRNARKGLVETLVKAPGLVNIYFFLSPVLTQPRLAMSLRTK